MHLNRVAELPRQARDGSLHIRLSEIAELVGGTLVGEDTWIHGVAGIRDASSGDLTFLSKRRYRSALAKSGAAAVLVGRHEPVDRPAVRVDDPALAFMLVARFVAAELAPEHPVGVHATAAVHESVRLGRDVCIGACVVLEAGVQIGDGTIIHAGAVIQRDASLGEQCVVYPNVTIYDRVQIGARVIIHAGAVLGSDGFGFIRDGNVLHKVPHIGQVVVEDDVEIGANTCIDRATTGKTRIRRGTKIDNLVQIAHNVQLGEGGVICAQTGISGSTEIGSRVRLGGQVGIAGHVTIGDDVSVAGQSGVTKSLPDGITANGNPAHEHRDELRREAAVNRLPELFAVIRDLRRRVAELEARDKT